MCFTAIAFAEEVETEPEITIESVDESAEIVAWLKENVNKDTISNIIHYFIESGLGVGLIATLIKFFKERKATKELVEEITSKIVNKIISEREETQQKAILNDISELKNATDTVIKALVLMQDSSSKGKVALLDLLNVSKDVKVQEVVSATKDVIEEQIKLDAEVKNAVKEDYKDIF